MKKVANTLLECGATLTSAANELLRLSGEITPEDNDKKADSEVNVDEHPIVDTTHLQIESLFQFMDALGYGFDGKSFFSGSRFNPVTEKYEIINKRYPQISFQSAVALHNAENGNDPENPGNCWQLATDYQVEGLYLYGQPTHQEIKNFRFDLHRINAAAFAKIFKKVKLYINKEGEIAASTFKVKPMCDENYHIYLKPLVRAHKRLNKNK